MIASKKQEGSKLTLALEGRIQSRVYTKVTEEGSCQRTAYEVSVMQFLEADE